jgi:hypothetical protein
MSAKGELAIRREGWQVGAHLPFAIVYDPLGLRDEGDMPIVWLCKNSRLEGGQL